MVLALASFERNVCFPLLLRGHTHTLAWLLVLSLTRLSSPRSTAQVRGVYVVVLVLGFLYFSPNFDPEDHSWLYPALVAVLGVSGAVVVATSVYHALTILPSTRMMAEVKHQVRCVGVNGSVWMGGWGVDGDIRRWLWWRRCRDRPGVVLLPV